MLFRKAFFSSALKCEMDSALLPDPKCFHFNSPRTLRVAFRYSRAMPCHDPSGMITPAITRYLPLALSGFGGVPDSSRNKKYIGVSMARKPRARKDRQVVAFRKAARQLGADESEDHFQGVLRTLARAKP